MKKSPFTLLRNEIENELSQHSLLLQKNIAERKQINADFVIGYNEALKVLLQKADYIYRYGKPPKY